MKEQDNHNKTIELLKKHQHDFPHVRPLLESDRLSAASFFEFERVTDWPTKRQMLEIYETYASNEEIMQKHHIRKDKSKVFGYDTLIQNLKSTTLTDIFMCNFETKDGTFIIFCDFDRTELIGVLLSESNSNYNPQNSR